MAGLGLPIRVFARPSLLSMVQFRLCDVTSSSALAWITFARETLARIGATGALVIPQETLAVLAGHLDEWETQASLGECMTLEFAMPAEQLEHLGHVFLQVSEYTIREADLRGYDISPPEADEFFAALSEAVISALEFSGDDSASEFAGTLRNDWPRTDRLMPDGTLVPVCRPLADRGQPIC